MSDFMHWLYANYIKPQTGVPEEGSACAFHLDLVRNCLRSSEWESLDRVLEFTAVQAFLLGLRTGEGLALSRR